jgi:hypothetical protein
MVACNEQEKERALDGFNATGAIEASPIAIEG